jgi:hypothetical protein
MPKTLVASRMGDVTDWSGGILPKQVLSSIGSGCFVRVVITNLQTKNSEAIYLKVTKVYDGTCWGIVQPTYRMDNWIRLGNGESFSVRLNEISEVPINWQPRWYRRKVAKWANLPQKRRYAVTGCR